jgi:hypothetical protein
MRSGSPPVQRVSTCALPPSVQPNCCRPCKSAAMRVLPSGSSGVWVISMPMRRCALCCVRPTTGHARAALADQMMDVHGIAHVVIEPCHHQVLRRCDRRRRAEPLQRKARKRVDEPGQTGGDQQHPDRARRLQVEERRPKLPMRDRPRDEPRQDAGRNRKKRAEPNTAIVFRTAPPSRPVAMSMQPCPVSAFKSVLSDGCLARRDHIQHSSTTSPE